jgi:cold shock CspA family protein
MKGKVSFFNIQRGFGKILNEELEDFFVHNSEVQGVCKVLYEGEEVEFETEITDKGPSAIKVIHLLNRKRGTIKEYQMSDGWGYIESDSEKFWFHHSQVIGQQGFKKIREDFLVEFTPVDNKGKLSANSIVCIDTRSSLEKFAFLGNWEKAIEDLANMAQKEEWDYLDEKTGKNPVLDSYIHQTFIQLVKEGKVEYAESNGTKTYAAFNIGLVTTKQEEIFAYFEINRPPSPTFSYLNLDSQIWRFLKFERESDRIMTHFKNRPALAHYFSAPTDLLYDVNRRLIPDFEHIVDDREDRFPDSFKSLSDDQIMERLRSAIDSALKRVKRNYKTAIPQFYHGGIQLLLPLCLEQPEKADLALVVSRENEIYRANTILPLDWAYNNARLLAKPDREWLNP